MPYYIVPVIEVAHRRRCPVGFDRGGNWILLDNDEALLWLPDSFADQRISKLGDDADEALAGATRTRLVTLTDDRPFRATDTLRNTIAGLLRTAPNNRWGSLRPSKLEQRYEIWLGPGGRGRNLLWQEAAIVGPNSKTFVDNFNRTAGNLNGSTSSDTQFTWAEVDGTDFTTNGTQVDFSPAAEQFNTAQAAANLDTDDHYSQIVLSGYSRAGGTVTSAGVIVRFSGGSGYSLEVGGGNTRLRIIKRYDNDASVVEDANDTTSGTLRLEVDGSSLTAYVNGVAILGPSTNTQFSGQLRCGIVGYTFPGGNGFQFDNFECGDLAAVAGRTTKNTRPYPLGLNLGINRGVCRT